MRTVSWQVRRGAVAACGAVVVSLLALPAYADPPVGSCTSSYAALDYTEAGQLPDGPLAQSIFPVIDSNHDGLVCYKPYPNGDHNGHYGNFVDDKAAPHS